MAERDGALLKSVLVADDPMIQRVAGGSGHVDTIEGVPGQSGIGGGGESFAGAFARTAGRAHRKDSWQTDDDAPASCLLFLTPN